MRHVATRRLPVEEVESTSDHVIHLKSDIQYIASRDESFRISYLNILHSDLEHSKNRT